MSADRPRLGKRILNEVVHAPGDVARGAGSELTNGMGIGFAALVEVVVGGVVGVAVGVATRNPELGLAAGTSAGSGVNAFILGSRGSYMRHNPEAVLDEELFHEQRRRIDHREPNMTPEEERRFLQRLRDRRS